MQETIQTLGIDLTKLTAQLVSFGIVFFILQKFAFGPILALLEQRRKTIEDALTNAEKVKKELAEAEVSRKEILSEANVKANQIIADAQLSATALADRKLQEAVAQAEEIISKARQATELDRSRMLQELRIQVSRLVIDTTAKVSGKVLTQDDQKRLSDETARQLAA